MYVSEGKGEHPIAVSGPLTYIFSTINILLCAERYNILCMFIKYYMFHLNYSYFNPVESISHLLKTFKGHFSKNKICFRPFAFGNNFAYTIYNIHVLFCFFYIVKLLGLN